jgi:hypothetical protein
MDTIGLAYIVSSIRMRINAAKECRRHLFSRVRHEVMLSTWMMVKESRDIMNKSCY